MLCGQKCHYRVPVSSSDRCDGALVAWPRAGACRTADHEAADVPEGVCGRVGTHEVPRTCSVGRLQAERDLGASRKVEVIPAVLDEEEPVENLGLISLRLLLF